MAGQQVTLTISAEDSASGILTKFTSGLDSLGKKAEETGRKIADSQKESLPTFQKLQQALENTSRGFQNAISPATLFGSVLGVVLVRSFHQASAEVMNYVEGLKRLSLVTDSSTEQLAALQLAAGDVGVETGTLQRAFFMLSNEIESGGSGLAKLGIQVRNSSGHMKSQVQILGDISTKLQGMTDKTQALNAVRDLFGRQGLQMMPLLMDFHKRMAEGTADAEKLGLAISEKTVKALKEYKIALGDVDDAMMGVKLQVFLDLFPVLDPLAKGMKTVAESFAAIGSTSIGRGVRQTIVILSAITAAVLAAVIAFGALQAIMASLGIGTLIGAIVTALAPFAFVIAEIVAAAGILVLMWGRLKAEMLSIFNWIRGGILGQAASALSEFLSQQMNRIDEFIRWVRGKPSQLQEAMGTAFRSLEGDLIQGEPEPIKAGELQKQIQVLQQLTQAQIQLAQATMAPAEAQEFAAKKQAEMQELQLVSSVKSNMLRVADLEKSQEEIESIARKTMERQVTFEELRVSAAKATAANIQKIRIQSAMEEINLAKSVSAALISIQSFGEDAVRAKATLEITTAKKIYDAGLKTADDRKKLDAATTIAKASETQQMIQIDQQYRTQTLAIDATIYSRKDELRKTELNQLRVQAEEELRIEDSLASQQLISADRHTEAQKQSAAKLLAIRLAELQMEAEAIQAQMQRDLDANESLAQSAKSRALEETKILEEASLKHAGLRRQMVEVVTQTQNQIAGIIRDGSIKAYQEEQTTIERLLAVHDQYLQTVNKDFAALKQRLNLEFQLGEKNPIEVAQLEKKAVEELITALQWQLKFAELSNDQTEALKSRVLELRVELKGLNTELSATGQMEKVFKGLMDVFSLFGVKLGKFIVMFQGIPKAISGIREVFAGLGGLIALGGTSLGTGTAWAEAAKSVSDLGNASGETAGVLGFLNGSLNAVDSILNAFGDSIMSSVSAVFEFITALGSSESSDGSNGSGLINSIAKMGENIMNMFGSSSAGSGSTNLFGMDSAGGNPGGFDLFGMGGGGGQAGGAGAGGGMMGGFQGFGGNMGGMSGGGWASIATILAQMAYDFKNKKYVSGALTGVGGVIGGYFGGPQGAAIGGQVGHLVGTIIEKIFGMGKPPMAKVKGVIKLAATNIQEIFEASNIAVADIVRIGHKSLSESGPFSLTVKKRHIKRGALPHSEIQEVIMNLVIDTVQEAVRNLQTLSNVLPTPALSTELSARLDAALEEGFEIAFKFKSRKPKKVIKKFNKWLEGLGDDVIEELTDTIFPTIDLKSLGDGSIVKGFDSLVGAMGLLSVVLTESGHEALVATTTLDQFAEASIRFVEDFQRGGETFDDTLKRLREGFAAIFGMLEQIPMSIAQITPDSSRAVSELVGAYQRSVQHITDASDALTIAIESGASPDEVAAAAQALIDATDVSMGVLEAIQQRLVALEAALVAGIDLYADLEVRIRELGGASTSLFDDLLNGAAFTFSTMEGDITDALVGIAESLAHTIQNIGAQIRLFEAALQVVGTSFATFSAALPQITALFNRLLETIRNTTDNAEAITQLQALAQAISNGMQAARQAVADEANRLREAAQEASNARIQTLEDERTAIQESADLRIQALEDERDLLQRSSDLRIQALDGERAAIQDAAQAQQEALNTQLDTIRQWKSLLLSVRAQLVDLFNLLAPTHPEESFNDVLAQFRAAVSGFGSNSTPDAAAAIQALAGQVLQLAQGVPGMDLPSAVFQALAAEVKAALEAVASVAESMPSEEEILSQIAESSSNAELQLAGIDAAIQAERDALESALAGIDAAIQAERDALTVALKGIESTIQAERDSLQAVLDRISADEKAQIAIINAQEAAALEKIRTELAIRLAALQEEAAQARDILKQITGNLTYEQFIAQKQSEAVTLLSQIQSLLQEYLRALTSSVTTPEPEVPSLNTSTVSQTLKDAGFNKKEREQMALVTAQNYVHFPSKWWTDLIFPLGFKMEMTLKEFFKKTFNTNSFDYTISQIEARLKEMVDAIPAMASGGIVLPRPGGTIVKLAEAGEPEIVSPFRPGNLAGGDTQIIFSPQITITGTTNARKMADELEDALVEKMQTGSRLRQATKALMERRS